MQASVHMWTHTHTCAWLQTCASMHICKHFLTLTCIYIHDRQIPAYMYTQICTHMHTCTHTSLHTYTHGNIHACIQFIHIYTYRDACLSTYIHLCMHTIYMHTCMHAHMYACMDVWMYVYMYVHVCVDTNPASHLTRMTKTDDEDAESPGACNLGLCWSRSELLTGVGPFRVAACSRNPRSQTDCLNFMLLVSS